MKRVLLTGMSGTGKSTVIKELAERGYNAVDADENGLSELVSVPDDEPTGLEPGQDWVWREDRIQDLLSRNDADLLFLSGCAPNQGKFYPQFDHVILLSAPADLIVERLATRATNPYGKRPEEVARTLHLVQTIEPILRSGAGHEVDTSAPLDQVVAKVLEVAGVTSRPTQAIVPPAAIIEPVRPESGRSMRTTSVVDRRQLAAWAGMIGPALYITVFTIEGWLRPGYDPRMMFVSELALGPRGWIQNANFILLGLLFLIFARGVGAEFRVGRAAKDGPILLALIGVSHLASGVFVMDPLTTPVGEMSWHGILHFLLGTAIFFLSLVSCFVFSRLLRVDPAWQSLQWWPLAVGVVVVGAVVVVVAVVATVVMRTTGLSLPLATPNAVNAWVGLVQRVAIIAYLMWVFTFAYRLRQVSNSDRNW